MRKIDEVFYHNRAMKRLIAVQRMDQAEEAALRIVKNIFEDAPTLGLDLDGTIDESPEFYKMLSNVWPGRVVVITCRRDEAKAKEDVEKFGVYYDCLKTVRRLEDKAEAILNLGVKVFIDDQDECLLDIPPYVTVLKMRNPGNFESGKWLYSDRTGKKIR